MVFVVERGEHLLRRAVLRNRDRIRIVNAVDETEGESLLRREPMIVAVEIGRADLLRGFPAFLGKHPAKGVVRLVQLLEILLDLPPVAPTAAARTVKHEFRVLARLDMTTAKGDDRAHRGRDPVDKDPDVGFRRPQGVEDRNPRMNLPAGRVDADLDRRI